MLMIAEFEATGADPVVPVTHIRRVATIIEDLAVRSVTAFGQFVVDNPVKSLSDLEQKSFAEFFARIAAEYVAAEATRRAVKNITDTTRSLIIDQIAMGRDEGLGISAIARMIAGRVASISRDRASLIARTETHNAANAGAFGAARETGVELWKRWSAISDDRTRDSHTDMNGTTIPMDQLFEVPRADGGVDLMMHPGDRDGGSAANTINCRCQVGFVRPPT
jgi:uncharacterized protein with gpF-like domain